MYNNGKPVFLQLEDISHNEGSLQGQQLQYPEKLRCKTTCAQDCLLHTPPPDSPTPAFFLGAHCLSLSVAHITCKSTMDLIWASVYILFSW